VEIDALESQPCAMKGMRRKWLDISCTLSKQLTSSGAAPKSGAVNLDSIETISAQNSPMVMV